MTLRPVAYPSTNHCHLPTGTIYQRLALINSNPVLRSLTISDRSTRCSASSHQRGHSCNLRYASQQWRQSLLAVARPTTTSRLILGPRTPSLATHARWHSEIVIFKGAICEVIGSKFDFSGVSIPHAQRSPRVLLPLADQLLPSPVDTTLNAVLLHFLPFPPRYLQKKSFRLGPLPRLRRTRPDLRRPAMLAKRPS